MPNRRSAPVVPNPAPTHIIPRFTCLDVCICSVECSNAEVAKHKTIKKEYSKLPIIIVKTREKKKHCNMYNIFGELSVGIILKSENYRLYYYFENVGLSFLFCVCFGWLFPFESHNFSVVVQRSKYWAGPHPLRPLLPLDPLHGLFFLLFTFFNVFVSLARQRRTEKTQKKYKIVIH
jgi:hypothetical protein